MSVWIYKRMAYSDFIILPKKQVAQACGDHRTISLISHLLKLFLKIIHQRIYRIWEERVTYTIWIYEGTRDEVFWLQVLFQRCRDMNCDIVIWTEMINVLMNRRIDDTYLRTIRNLYWKQSATIRATIRSIWKNKAT